MSANIPCRVCTTPAAPIFRAKVIGKYDVQYYECPNCSFVQVEEPHWLEEVYSSPINLTDTGILLRNLQFQRVVSTLLYFLFSDKPKFLDYAGGYGIFTRLMRDQGFDYYWDDMFTKNLVARGFEYKPELGTMTALTAFETFEHFVTPVPEVEKLLKYSDTIVFSTQLAPRPTPQPQDWWYYGLEHGQHTALYRLESLQNLGNQFDLQLYSNNSDLHLFTKADLVPYVVDQEFLSELLTAATPQQVQLLRSAYKSPAKLKLRRRLKQQAKDTWAYMKDRGFYVLDEALATEDRQQLAQLWRSSGIINKYVNSLLQYNKQRENFMLRHVTGKTFNDMLAMREVMLNTPR